MARKKRTKRELSDLEHKAFWIVIGMVFLLSVMTILSLIDSDSLTGHATVQNIAYMKEGNNLFFEIRNVEGMQFADIELLETVKGSQIIFNDEDLVDFEGKTFNSFTVETQDAEKFGSVTYTLKIKTADLLPAGLSFNDVTLYVNGKEVKTVKTSTEDVYTFYTANLDKFEAGDYVIGLAAVKQEEPDKIIEQEPVMEEKAPLVGEAIQPSKSKEGFFSKIVNFFKSIFG